jgi:hypothetical protein
MGSSIRVRNTAGSRSAARTKSGSRGNAAVSDFTVRGYTAGDEIAINAGFNRVFGMNRALAEWQWKFREEPEGRWIMIAVDEAERVIGHCGAVPVRLQVGKIRVRAGQLVDSFTRPEARRGLGAARVFLRTAGSFAASFGGRDGLALLFGFAGDRLVRLGTARLGYGLAPPQPVGYWVRSAHKRMELQTGHEIRPGFDAEAIDDLWRRAAPRYEVAVVRDGAWLGRRFTSRPGVEYGHLSAWRQGRVCAWAVVRVQPPVTRWVELVWDGEDPGALAALDRAITTGSLAVKLERLDMWLMGDKLAVEALRRLGWEPRKEPDKLSLVARSFHPDINAATLPGRFYVTMGDWDRA